MQPPSRADPIVAQRLRVQRVQRLERSVGVDVVSIASSPSASMIVKRGIGGM